MPVSRLLASILLLGLAGLPAQTVQLQPKMGAPLAGLSAAERALFDDGRVAFDHVFTQGEGLGPIFNQNSCASCHNNPVGGSGTIKVTRFGALDPKGGGFDPLENLGGSLLQSQAISLGCAESIPPEANIVADRVTPSILGAGLIEAIPDADILARAAAPGGGTSGSVHMVPELETPGGTLRAGRFGWKSQLATLLSFSGDASLMEMGITNRLVMQENAPNGNTSLLASCDTVADPEHGPGTGSHEFIDRITFFQRYLAPPPQTPRSGMTGDTIFLSVGCGDCHVPAYITANDPALESALRNQTVKAYSDFLLHEMGLNADFIVQGGANEMEIRTPPLWGLRTRDPLWHDGRVSGGTLADRLLGPGGIIELHDSFLSEAQPSAQAFQALSVADKAKVVAFLDSLGRAEFDHDGNNVIDRADLDAFELARSTPGVPTYTADDPEAVFDVDADGDVDDDDFNLLVLAYEQDCNGNGVGDLLDIFQNFTSFDSNNNLTPDECEVCQANLGYGGPGSMVLTVCGDDLTQPGARATALLEGAASSIGLFVAVSHTALPLSVLGGTVVPELPFLWFTDAYSTDSSGRLQFSVAGGVGPPTTYVIQVAAVNAGTVEFSNAVQVLTGF